MVAIFTGAGTGFERGSGSVLGGAGLLGSAWQGTSGESVLVNAATGNLLISQQDEYLVGLGPDATVSRTYNSLGDLSDDNGDNWRQSTDRRVYGLVGTVDTAGSSVSRVSGDGSVELYNWDATKGAYISTDGSGAYDKLTYAGGVWSWTDGASQATESYAAYGTNSWRITRAADTDGNALTFSYTGAELTQLSTADGSWLQYSWSGDHITQITTGYTDLASSTATTLTRTRYGYDSSDRLTSVTVDLSPGDNSIADGKVYTTSYTYNGATTQVATISETDGSKLAVGYDPSGRVTSLVQTAASGVTRTTGIAYGSGYTNVTDATGQVTRLDYNADGSLKQVTMPPAYSGAAAQTLQYSYTATGDVHTITDATGKVTTFGYDAWGNVTSQTDPLGNVVTRSYGAKNELLTETVTGSDTGSAAAAHTTRYVYDAEDHLRYTIGAEGNVTEYRYTAAGELQYVIGYPEQPYDLTGLGATTSPSETTVNAWRDALPDRSSTEITLNGYDARGNLAWTIDYGAATTAGAGATTEGYTRTYFTYDQAGQLLSRYTLNQATETFVYDGLGRLTASTDINGGTTSIAFNDAANTTVVTLASGLVTTSSYDKAGDLLSVAQSGSYVTSGTTSYVYDQLGRVRMTTDATGYKSYVVYDDTGRKVADVDQYGDMTEYRYDADNRLVASVAYATPLSAANLATLANPDTDIALASIRPAANAADLWNWQVYDADGRIAETIDGTGGAAAYSYDGAGRLIKTTDYANKLSASQLTTFKTTAPAAAVLPTADALNDAVTRSFYDKDGRLVGALDGAGYLTGNVYDDAGQLVEQDAYATISSSNYRASGTFAQLLASVGSSAADRATHYVYDGRALRYVVDALNQVTEYDYNYAGQVTHITGLAGSIAATSDYTFDNIKSLVASSGLATNAATRNSWAVYDTAGRVAYAIDAEGAVTGFSYDSAGNAIKTVQYATKCTTTSLPSEATMDAWAATSPVAANADNRVTRDYYDARGELRYAVDPEGYVDRIDYDAAGRVVRDVRWSSAITVDDSTTIAQVAALVAGEAWVDTKTVYDADGRVSTVSDGDGYLTGYAYNANGTLASTTRAQGTADASVTTYAYDGAGRKITQTDAYGTPEAAVIQFGYTGLGDLISTTDADGNVTSYSYDQLGRMLTTTDALGGVTSYQYDAFGDQVKVTDARGNASWSYYDGLGRLVSNRDAENYVTETGYDAFGDIASVNRRYNKATNTASATTLPVYTADPVHDAVTTFAYDRLGRLVKTTDAENAYEQYTLDAFGQRSAVRNKLGATTTYTYDGRGLELSETLPISSVTAAGATEAAAVTNTFQYDARGNLTKKIEAAGLTEQRTTTYAYDASNRLISATHDTVPNGTGSGTVTPTEHYYYDARGNLIKSTDANGASTFNYYDHLDRLTVTIDPLGDYSSYSYDDNGNMLTNRSYGAAVALPTTPGGTPPPAPSGSYRQTSYTYDKLNRLVTTSVAGIRTGSWNGSSYSTTASTTITTSLAYDATGNVILSTDANGAKTYSYYDKLGRKTAQVDPDNYLTAWTLDDEGNTLSEQRYATAATGTITTTAPPTITVNAADRITAFTYDQMGNRLTETRANVAAYTINATNGALTALPATTGSTITYTYNALGQVLTKKQPTGDTFSYSYDTAGRLVSETRAAYVDQTGASVAPTLRYSYDGLGDLTRSQQGGAVANSSTDHITTYSYGAGGRLTAMTDATGQHQYYYDAAGRKVGESYTRLHADGTSSLEGIGLKYDALGRLVQQTMNTVSGTTWTQTGDVTNIAYDAYGDVTKRGISATATAAYQELFSYDAMGRLTATNQGDGVWRFYVYDANGNQTLALESEGANLSNMTVDQALAVATANGAATVGASYIDGIDATVTSYDKRGQATSSVALRRQLDSGDTTTATTVNLTTSQTYDAFGEVASATDALGHQTKYSYNTMGRRTAVTQAAVSVTDAHGVTTTVSPTETSFYDIAGRLIGTADADGNTLTQLLVAGTGYDGSDALTLREFHADGGSVADAYDVFGDLRKQTDAVGRVTTDTYDKADELIEVDHAGGLVDHYGYDGLGQRITHWNNLLGSGNVETTDYDIQGRVTRQVAFGGDTTTTSYAWNAALATAGLGTFGGWTQTTTYANGKTSVEQDDLFGHVLSQTDLGGHVYNYAYDEAGRVVSKTPAAAASDATAYSYFNTGLVATIIEGTYGTAANQDTFSYTRTAYGYDADGRETAEAEDIAEGGWYEEPVGNGAQAMSVAGDDQATSVEDDDQADSVQADAQPAAAQSDPGPDGVAADDQTDDQMMSVADGDQADAVAADGAQGEAAMQPMIPVNPPPGDPPPTELVYESGDAVQYQDSVSYDALGRMTQYVESANNALLPATMRWKYDAAGNVREKKTLYDQILPDGTHGTTQQVEDDWYLYDSMNRMTLDAGSLTSGQVVRGTGTALAYDAAGERTSATTTVELTGQVANPGYGGYAMMADDAAVPADGTASDDGAASGDVADGAVDEAAMQPMLPMLPPGGGGPPYLSVRYAGDSREDYSYDAAGDLQTVRIAQSGYVDNGDGTLTVTAPPPTGAVHASYTYDLMGRVTDQKEYVSGTTLAYEHITHYNAKGQVDTDTVVQLGSSGTTTTATSYSYGSGTGYALGAATATSWTMSGATSASGSTSTSYAWYAGAVTASTTTNQAGTTSYATTFAYDPYGVLDTITVGGAKPRNVYVTSDMAGAAIDRNEWNPGGAAPHEMWYRFGGAQLGYLGNNGTEDTDYLSSIEARGASGTGYFRGGAASGTSDANFDQAYDPYTSYAQGSTGGSYTAQAGDSLSSVAAQLWGDSSLWYKLAEANGLSGDATLGDGQMLTVPAGVTRSANSATTFQPYDPNDAVGNISGVNPVPAAPKNHGCGVFGAILELVIAVAVVAIVHVPIANLLESSAGSVFGAGGALGITGTTIASGALAGAAGSLVSQGVGVATGIQDKVDWTGVALAGIGGGVGGALGGIKALNGASGILDTAQGAARGALGDIATQGVALATGLQSHFDWTGVAVGASVGAAAGSIHLGGPGGSIVSGLAGALAGGAARSLIDGSDFGDNVIAALPDVIGSTVGTLVAAAIDGSGRPATVPAANTADTGSTAAELQPLPGDPGTMVAYLADGPDAQAGPAPAADQSRDIIVTGIRDAESGLAGFWHRLEDGASALWSDVTNNSLVQTITNDVEHAGTAVTSVASEMIATDTAYYTNVYDQAFGPQSAYQRFVSDPFTKVVAPLHQALMDSPLVDPGALASIEPGLPPPALAVAEPLRYAQTALRALSPVAEAADYSAPALARIGDIGSNGVPFEGVVETVPNQLQLNQAAGAAFQARVNAFGADALDNFVGEVSIRPNTAIGSAPFKIRIDGLGTNPETQAIDLLEAKGSATAPLTRNQTAGFPLIEQYGGTIVGANGGLNYPAGTVISRGTGIRIIRPSDLSPGY